MDDLFKQIAKFKAENPEYDVVFSIKLKDVAIQEDIDLAREIEINERPKYVSRAKPGESIMDRWKLLHVNDPPIPCQQCSKPFKQLDAKQKFCSEQCKIDAKNKARLKEEISADCVWCGKTFAQTRSDKKYCSVKCMHAAERVRAGKEPVGKFPHTCPQCSRSFYTSHVAQKYCSSECSLAARRGEKKTQEKQRKLVIEAKPDKPRLCRTCDTEKPSADFYPKSLSQCKECYAKQVSRRRIEREGKTVRHCPNCQKVTAKIYCTDKCRREYEKSLLPGAENEDWRGKYNVF